MKLFGFVPIAREGLIYILISILFDVIFYLVYGLNPVTIVLILITFFVIYFFRNPDRSTPQENNLIISPADGRVVYVGEETSSQLNIRQNKISIFMSIFNVHINRMPTSGRIKAINYNSGKFFNAATPKASLNNEQNAILVERNDKREILFVQIAGFIARRIVCYLSVGKLYAVGERMGLIKFGSRVDVYLPLDCQITVNINDKVKGGETIIAKIPESNSF